MTTTNIEWTDKTWNPVTGCTKVSPGCAHCYAEGVAERFWAKQYPERFRLGGADVNAVPVSYYERDKAEGLTRPRQFTDVMTHSDRLDQPLRWKKPARIFVNSMSDLFHEDVPSEFIARSFAVMALAERHTFQVLTKRAKTMRKLLNDPYFREEIEVAMYDIGGDEDARTIPNDYWPLPNVWLGVSVENQRFSDERLPLLRDTPAAVRFLSVEPMLGPVDFTCDTEVGPLCQLQRYESTPGIDWVIVGGESGPKARPFHVAWARSIAKQCKAANVPVFVKQLGARIIDRNDAGFMGEWPEAWPDHIDIEDRVEHNLDGTRDGYQGAPVRVHLRSKKGGDPAEWPEDLRVRQFPEAARG